MQDTDPPPPASPPWPVRLANSLAASLESVGFPLLRFEPEELRRLACKRAGLELEIDDPRENEGLERLCTSLEQDAQLNLVGRMSLREHVVGALTTRLLLEHIRREEPARLEWQGPPPIVIVGLPRSGTTLLHRLLAEVPGHRALALWQVRYPLRGPGKDRRLAEARKQVQTMRSIAPVLDTKHPIGPEDPEECGFLMDPSFLSVGYWIFAPATGYLDWLLEQDMTPAYRCWADLLAMQQAEHPEQRLLLEAPAHCGYLAELVAALPGARLIQLHREPETIAVSMSSLFHSFHAMMSANPDPRRLGAANLRLLETWLRRNSRARPALGDQLIELRYTDLLADPLGTVRAIHDHHDLGWKPNWEPALQAWIDAHPQDAAGPHRYRAETFGLTMDELRSRLAPLTDG